MSLNEVHIVAAKDGKGALKLLYCGEDAAQAEEKYAGAKDDLQMVGILNFPTFSRQRNPAADVERQKEREQFVVTQAEAVQKQKEIAAENLRKQAEALLAKAETIDPKKSPEVESEKPDEAKGKNKNAE